MKSDKPGEYSTFLWLHVLFSVVSRNIYMQAVSYLLWKWFVLTGTFRLWLLGHGGSLCVTSNICTIYTRPEVNLWTLGHLEVTADTETVRLLTKHNCSLNFLLLMGAPENVALTIEERIELWVHTIKATNEEATQGSSVIMLFWFYMTLIWIAVNKLLLSNLSYTSLFL